MVGPLGARETDAQVAKRDFIRTQEVTSMSTHAFKVAAATALFVTSTIGTPSLAAKPSYGCPGPFTLHALTEDDYASLPNSQAAIDDGLISLDDLLAGAATYDRNGDNLICVQANHGMDVSQRPFAEYLYNVVDNNASTD
jgi:hypothetical protein